MDHTDDIVVQLSERVLQHALGAYAAEHVMYRVFSYPDIGVTFLGGEMDIALDQGSAEVSLAVQAVFQVVLAKVPLPPQRETIHLKLRAGFLVEQGELCMRVQDGSLRTSARGLIEKAANKAVQLLIRQIFARPLIRLPVRLDVAAPSGESTDETCLTLARIEVKPGLIQIGLRMDHTPVAPPSGYPLVEGGAGRSRGRAIALVRLGIAARQSGRSDLAAGLFYRAALQADPSFAIAWIWLSTVVQRPGERRYCLERALAIEPHYQAVRDALAGITQTAAVCPDAHAYPIAI